MWRPVETRALYRGESDTETDDESDQQEEEEEVEHVKKCVFSTKVLKHAQKPSKFLRRLKKRPPPSMRREWDDLSRWRLTWMGRWRQQEHINVQELRVVCMTLRRLSMDRRAWKKQVLIATDSQVTLGCVLKGRSSSFPLLRQMRMIASVSLALQIRIMIRYLESERNPGDGPSRLQGVGAAKETILAHQDRVIRRAHSAVI